MEGNQIDMQQHLREMQGLLRVVTHDLRAPVRGIRALVGLLGDDLGGSLEPNHQMILDQILSSADTLNVLVDGLSRYARLTGIEMAEVEVDLTSCATRAAELHGGAIQAEIESLPTTRGDAHLLQEVFELLFDNAVLHSGQGPARVSVQIAGQGIRIRTFGNPVAEEIQRSLMEPFVTTVRGGARAGLGLSVARRIVQLHGGTLEFEPEWAEGAQFLMTLPGLSSKADTPD